MGKITQDRAQVKSQIYTCLLRFTFGIVYKYLCVYYVQWVGCMTLTYNNGMHSGNNRGMIDSFVVFYVNFSVYFTQNC